MADLMTGDGVRLRYEVRGEGPPVYVLHGGPSNICDTLIRDLEPLAEGFTLVFHDYRGSGQSSPAPAHTYTFEQLADDLDALRRHLGHPSMRVLAHSMGGFVALRYALRHPDACAALALVATTPTSSPRALAIPTLRALGPVRAVRVLLLMLRFLAFWSWRNPSPARTAAMSAPMAVTEEPRRQLRSLVAAAHPEVPVDNDNAQDLLHRMGATDLCPQLPSVACPALVLYGSRDAVMVAGGQLLAHRLPGPEVHVLDDVGHEPFIEAPNETFPVLRRFLISTEWSVDGH